MLNIEIVIALLGGYLLGSIPFGLLLARLAGQGDIRNIGSGNIGATNVLRTGRKDLAVLTLVLDAGKAGLAALVFGAIFAAPAALIAGAAALVGHCFPLWLKFKGGKGVATYFGVLLVVAPLLGLSAAALWVLSAFVTRTVSLAGVLTALIIPVFAYFMISKNMTILCLVMGVVIILRHHENIARIFAGTEPKIGSAKK